ncbi:hypothetical protein [Sphaerisporangium album]|uniref:hypothetical protein n=1 Tax=Sphaerisporangium album TaxID=509200 RepID=UPI0015F00538|nr:hypothetical protein [Sphaerisporangium album]
MRRARSLRALRRRCEARLRELPLPAPFDVRELCAAIAEQRGRPIRLLPMTGQAGLWGLWVATDTADFILYEQATTPPHQEHIILHELSHLLCDHYGASFPAGDGGRELLPSLDPRMVHTVLGRSAYSAVEEQEAELLASLIQQRARRPSSAPGPSGQSGVLNRLLAALDWTQAGPPDPPR